MEFKRALLIAAHGSRRQQSNDEIKHLAERIGQQAAGQFDQVGHAFLELAEPSIAASIDQCIEQGATEVIVLPYFLAAGRHVVEDVPGIVAAKQQQYGNQGISIKLKNYIGASTEMIDLVLEAATAERCACAKLIAECGYPQCQV